jgi:integrase
MLVADWAERWWAARGARRSTMAAERSRLDNHVLPAFGHLPLHGVTRIAVQGWVTALKARPLAAETVRSCYSVLRMVMGDAVLEGLVVQSPCYRIALPTDDDPREPVALETTQAAALLRALPGWARPHALVSLATGLRWGEAAGLRRGDVELLRRRLQVREALHEVRGHLYTEGPKTRTSRRTLPLPAAAVEVLAAHLPHGGQPADLVFTAQKGGPLRNSNYRAKVWLPAVEAAGLEGLHFHDLRHTYASWLEDGGIPRRAIEELLGHAGAGGVTGRYLHSMPGVVDRAVAALDERLPAGGVAWAELG